MHKAFTLFTFVHTGSWEQNDSLLAFKDLIEKSVSNSQQEQMIIPFSSVRTLSGAHPATYAVGAGGCFPGSNAAGWK
jgi:hypothetical protein